MPGVDATRATATYVFLAISNFITTRVVIMFLITRNIYNISVFSTIVRYLSNMKKAKEMKDCEKIRSTVLPIYTLHDGRLESIDDEETMAPSELKTSTNTADSSSIHQQMSSAEVLRSAIVPLGMNNSLNIQRNENNNGTLASGISSLMQNNSDRVPLDRPLFINTNMTAQQRIDIYRRLTGPPQDSEPALLFRMP